MNMDLVLILSGWLFGIIMAILAAWVFLKLKQMKENMEKVKEAVLASIKDKKITDIEKKKLSGAHLWIVPEDVDPTKLTKQVIDFLDVYWNNPHLKRRAQEIYDKLAPALKKWNDEE